MTEEQKRMKHYTSAIERRLNLPKEIKVRVMSDLISAIEARREAGKTDEEIYAELGSPQKAAADLNEQMKEYAYRKSPWRFVFAVLAFFGGAELLGTLAVWIIALLWTAPGLAVGEAASIGVIGGADGPTAIFVTSPSWMAYIRPAAMLLLGISGYLSLRKCRQK